MAVEVEIAGGVATLTMSRPEALNAFNSDQLNQMIDAFRIVRDDSSVRVVILTGAGERAFAAGADIKEMATQNEYEALEFARRGHAITSAVEVMTKPTIAAVNGFALGGGCEIALGCDIR